MKEKINLKNRKTILLSVITSILVIIGIISFILNKPKANNVLYSSELERAEIEQMRTYDKVEVNDSKVENCPNIEFDAFFARDLDGDGYSEGIRGSCIQIGKEDTLYMELHINDGGTLKNGKITINNDNFYFDTAIPKSEDVKENAISNNTKEILLTDTDTNRGTGKQITLTGNVKSGTYDRTRNIIDAIGNDISKLSNNENSQNRNSITLTGTYVTVDEEGQTTETEINKTVYFNLDWYGTTSTSLPNYLGNGNYNYKNQKYNIQNIIDEENQEIHLDFKVLTRENNYQLNLNNSEIKINLPEIQECSPIRVEAEGAEVKYIYDETDSEKILGAIISKKAVLDENNTVKENAYTDTYAYTNAFYRYNIFNIKVIYPIDAYNKIGGDAIQLKLPIEAFYEGYNNPNSEFESVNPYKSNIAKDTMIVTFKNPEGNAAYVNVKVGKYYGYPWYTYLVAKKNPINVYNGISENIGNDTYEVNWYGMTGSEGESKGLVLKETEIGQEPKNVDQFITSSGRSISMEDVVKNIGIYMSNPEILLGEDGWVKVYDDDDEGEEPLVTFTKENWNKYNQSNPYKYDEPVSHIRIETSSTNADSYFYFYSVKEINTDYIAENYTKEEFLDFKYIQSSVVLYLDSGEKRINSYAHQASYEPSISLADVWVSSSKIPTTEEKNLRINIDTETYDNKEKWVNGIFLLKLPQEMASVEINDVKISNSNVKLANYELYKENDETFIKIITENIDPQSYTITVDCKIIPDATALSSTKYIELYAINEYCTNYHSSYSAEDIYDINKNINLNELVNYDIASVQFVSTNNLLTSEIITNYDDENNTTYAPSVAGVVKVDRTARVNIKINNNYSGTNSEVVILGRIPFEGNKYVDSGKDMNSTFTTTMSNNGIRVPDVLKNVVTVYYSENGEATRDFNEVNNWQTVPTDYSKIKSFMIKFNDDYKLQRGEKHEFYYDITIPQDVALNAESYSHHAVYFCWDTPQGKYRTKVEPSKVGISPVEKFNLEITKYQTGFDKLVPGATYSVSEVKNIEDGEELVNSRTETTEENGKLLITGLYINKVYEIKEVKTPEGYELNEDVIRISTTINSETRELTTEKITGNIKGDIAVSQEERKISLQVEDETKAKLRLVKTEDGKSEIKLANARFEIKGEGLPTSGKLITTDAQGIAELSGLKIGSIYTIKETYSPSGYYLLEGEVKFKIVNNNNGTFTTEIVEGTAKNSNAVVEDYVPVAVIELTNEKIPIFKLVKTEEANNIPLSGVRFKLYGKGMYENGTTLTTNENGEITLSSLYLNEEYTLQETRAKQGYYIKTEEIKFHIENNNGNYRLIIEQGNEIVKSIQITDTDGVPTLVLTMENERIPVFKIVKKAQGTNDSLSRVRYNIKGKGLPENGTTLTTNENGETQISNLYLNEIYTLKETEAKEGYYIKPETIKFKIVNNNGNYSLEIVEGSEIVKFIDKTEVDNVPYLILNMDNEKIPTFNLDITKVEKDKPEVLLEGAKFRVYRGEVQVGEYISDVNGKIVIPDLCQYVEEKKDIFNSTYRLQEVESPEGYVPIKDITFKVQEIDGTLKFIQEQTEDATMQAFEVEGNTIKLVLEDTPTFKLIKVDGEQTTEVRLPNTKFAIFNINEDEEVPATDSKGNILGTLETIDGKDYYTLTTDENGEFRAELQEGFYKAVEVQVSNDKFELSNQVYYFGIGKSKKSVELNLESMVQLVENSQETSDGGYIGYEDFTDNMKLSNGVILTSKSSLDTVIVKYDSIGNIEWYQQLSPNDTSNTTMSYITSIVEVSQEKFLVSHRFKGDEIEIGNGVIIDSYTVNGRHTLGSTYNNITILYGDNGNIDWAINGKITKKETNDGGYILAGTFKGESITLEDGVILKNNSKYERCGGHSDGTYHSNNSLCDNLKEGYNQDAFIVKYDNNGRSLWNKVIEADKDVELNISYTNNYYSGQNILIQANQNIESTNRYRELENGSFLITGNCSGSEINFGDGKIEDILDSGLFFAIYDINGNIVNARISAVTDIVDTADGGFVTYGDFYNEIDLKKENNIEHIVGQTEQTGLIVKYREDGVTEWHQIVEEVKNSSTQNVITDIQKLSDESYISFSEIQYLDENNNNNNIQTVLVVKYNNLMQEQWRKEIGKIDESIYCYNNIYNVIKTSDNGYIFFGNINYINEDSNFCYKQILVKLNNEGIQEWEHIIELDAYSFGDIVEANGNIFITTRIDEPIKLENDIEITDSGIYIINYNSEMQVQWIIKFRELGDYFIPQIYEIFDGGFILTIDKQIDGTVNIGNNVNIEGIGEFSVKYDNNGIPQWVIRGDYRDLIKLSNNEYISSLSIHEEKMLDLGNNIVVNGPGQFIIKYDENNIVKQVVKGTAYPLTDMASESISIDGKINQISSIENTNLNITLFESEIMDLGDGLTVKGPGEFYVDFENKKITNSMLQELKTEDGGLIKYGYITQESKNRRILRPNYEYTDGVIIKYDKDNNVEWRKIIGGELSDGIVYMMQTKDKGFLAVASLESLSAINLGNGTIIENKTPSYVMIKYDELGNAQWYSKICEYESMMNYLNIGINQIKQTDEGKYIVDLTVYQGELNIGNAVIEGSWRGQPRVIINYNPVEKNEDNPIVEYAKSVEGNLDDVAGIVISTRDGGYITGESHVEKPTISTEKAMILRRPIYRIVKYDKNGQKIWETIELDYTPTSIYETNDNGYLVLLGNGIILKVDNNGSIVWQHDIENSNQVATRATIIHNVLSRGYTSIIETNPGEYIVAGTYSNDSVDLGNGIILENKSDTYRDTEDKLSNGIIIKYKENEEKNGCQAIWAKQIEGTKDDEAISVIELDNKIVVGANIYSSTNDVDLGNGVIIPNNSENSNGVVITYDYDGNAQSYNVLNNTINILEKATDGYVIINGNMMIAQANQGTLTLSESNGSLSSGDKINRGFILEVVKYNKNGNIEWNKPYENITVSSIEQTIDGGYIVGGIVRDSSMADEMVDYDKDTSTESRAADNAAGESISSNGIILKLNREGNEEWRREIEETGIYDATQIKDTGYIAVGSYTAQTLEFENGIVLKNKSDTYREIIDRDMEWNEETGQFETTYIYSDEEYYYSDGMIINLNAEMMIPEKQELIVKNYYKRFNITTEVELVNGVKGGSITGEGLKPYEEVVYGNTSTKPIVMTPEDEKYEIVGITVNGKDYPFEVEADGSFTMPQFENVTEDKHIVVKYCYKDNKIIINKVDSESGESLEGAKFKLMPEGYVELDYLDAIMHDENDQYYFEKSEDGSYKSNNQGMSDTQAHSSIEVDLTDYEGEYLLEVNASISADNPLYNGVVTVVEQMSSGGGSLLSLNNTAENENSSKASLSGGGMISARPLINITGKVEAQNYTRVLIGGSKYTINFIYNRFDNQGGIILQSDNEVANDTFTINSVKVMSNEFYTVETNSNGQAITNIPFGKYTIKEIYAPDGYILNTEAKALEFRPTENGEDADTIHTFTFENIKKPKVIVHYYKIDSEGNYTAESLADDIVLTGNPDESYTTEIIKNLEKDGIEYELENTITDDGTKTYVIPDNSTGKFKLGENQEVIYYYVEKKVPLTVHHYIQGTTVRVPLVDGTLAKDERFSGKEEENYTTEAITVEELSKEYELVAIPDNSTGIYGKDEIVVTYYYKKVDKNVSIFKYALQKQVNEETGVEEEVKVPLAGAEFTILPKQGTTENLTSLDEEVENQQASRIQVGGLGNTTEVPKYTTDENGKIDVNLEVGEYVITEVKAPEGYVLPEGEDAKHTIIVSKETEDGQLIEIENQKPQGTVMVYHYQLDKEGKKTEIPVQIKDGENLIDAPVEIQTGDVGSIYATKPVENLPINWKYIESEGETSGTYAEGEPKVVKYYYKEVDFEETIDIELTKIWKDNEIQALRRPKRIKFTVTPYIENVNQVVIDEKIVSEEYLGNTENTVNQEQNGIQISQETINNEIVNETEILKENTNEQEIPSENIKSSEVNIENLEQETKTDEISNDSTVEESNNYVNTTDDTNNIANIVEENSSRDTIAESKETTNTISQVPTELSNTLTDKNNVQENNFPESDTQQSDAIENNQTEEVTIQELEVTQYYVNVEKGENFTYTLEGLPKYDKTTGSVIHYKITESYDDENGSPDDLKFYTSQGGDVIELIDETGNIKYTSRIINTFTLPSENSKNIKGIKVWNDRENVRNTRPLSIILELVGRINKTDINNEIKQETILSKEQAISFGNNWEYTFENNPIYNADGQEIEYSVDERESIEGSLNKYSKTIITNEDKSEFTITNTLNVQGSNITKTGTEILRAIDGKVNYTINYNAELDVNYSQDENIIVTIVDSLPYKISEKERNIAGGAYDEEKQTITWTGTYNTKSEEQVVVWADGSKTPVTFSEEKQVKVVTFDKKISFSYLGLTTKNLDSIINQVSGTIKLEKSEETVESNCKTLIEYEQDVVVNKLWNGDTEETRPDSITVQLKQVVEDENGNVSFVEIQDERVSEELKNPITIEKTMENEETEWTYTYKNLPRYDEEGNELKFTVVETEVNYTKGEQTVENKYYCEKTEEVKDGNTIITLTNNAYGSITLTKVDSRKEDVKLAGAEFKLERVIKDETTGEYVVPEEGSEEYFVTTGTTGENGTLKFENLKYGFYKLTETKAPEDYRISKNPIEIIEVNSSDDEHLNAQVTVGNDKKYSLPLTGGHGTNIIRNIGILVISLVAILFTNRKKVVPVKREKTEKVSKPIRRKNRNLKTHI